MHMVARSQRRDFPYDMGFLFLMWPYGVAWEKFFQRGEYVDTDLVRRFSVVFGATNRHITAMFALSLPQFEKTLKGATAVRFVRAVAKHGIKYFDRHVLRLEYGLNCPPPIGSTVCAIVTHVIALSHVHGLAPVVHESFYRKFYYVILAGSEIGVEEFEPFIHAAIDKLYKLIEEGKI